MASLSDIMTTAQNIVQAINGVAQTYRDVQGTKSSQAIAASTLVSTAPGRLAVVSVTTAGAVGVIYDANATGVTTKPIYSIPAALGAVLVNVPVVNGIVVVPGAGQVVTVTYS